jgi:FAD/FMN-containing dehydrogenase
MSSIVDLLLQAVGKDAILTPIEAAERPASRWLSTDSLTCKALALPNSTSEVAAILRLCHQHGQTVVPHGGLTNVVGGVTTTSDDIALSLERMNVIEQIDLQNKTITVQAGTILQDVQKAVAETGLLFPLDLGAKGSCMIGGNISTNAGGLQALRYGVMRQLVLGLEVVLADGTVVSSMNKMLKNNAGYDLKHLFIGSEGTLGVITKAILKLEDAPKSKNTALIGLTNFGKAIDFLQAAKRELASKLTTYEIIWQDYYRLMTSPPSTFTPPLSQQYPYYVLMEALGQNQEIDEIHFQTLLENSLEEGLIEDAALAKSQQELDWFWGIREKVDFVFQVHQPVFLFDVSLPITDMELYIQTVINDLKSIWPYVHFYSFGHMGDGNLHLFVSCGENTLSTRHQVEEIVFLPLQKIGGSITAEHGIGLEKKPWLHLSRTPEEIALMRTLKHALDPKGILNPGKVV